jgi:hypothetical protein
LHDGTVISAVSTPNWYKLTPDAFGGYNGTWSRIGRCRRPTAFSHRLAADGRVIVRAASTTSRRCGRTSAIRSAERVDERSAAGEHGEHRDAGIVLADGRFAVANASPAGRVPDRR